MIKGKDIFIIIWLKLYYGLLGLFQGDNKMNYQQQLINQSLILEDNDKR